MSVLRFQAPERQYCRTSQVVGALVALVALAGLGVALSGLT
jgi:hypothetical protein